MEKNTKKEIIIYGTIILAIILIRSFVITPVRVNGDSMDTTLKDGEIMILNKFTYKFNDINRFDIVVINRDGEKLIKRIIGLPGETLEYKSDKLYINEKEVKEPFKNQEMEDFSTEDLGYEKIPDNCYIALGDNRSVSLDSRYFGCFKKEEIKGKANFVIFPFSSFGKKE